MAVQINDIQFHLAHACNLHCKGCSHYSNYGVKSASAPGGIMPFETGKEWLTAWSKRIKPRTFHLLGGEPAINPRFKDYIYLTKELFPETELRIFSNGLLLGRHPTLDEALIATDASLVVSIHGKEPEYVARMNKIMPLLGSWQQKGAKVFVYNSNENWYDPYVGEGKSMKPFADGNPRKAWEVCAEKACPQLHENKLWKCPSIAYLGQVADRFDLHGVPEWKPYLAVDGLSLDATDAEIAAFFAQEEVDYCGMCPTKLDRFELETTLGEEEAVA